MPYEPDCLTDTRVFCNGVRLPVGDVDVHVRKEGPADVTRYAEVEFASPWNGEDYLSAFNGARPEEQTEFDTLRIDVKDTISETYSLAFRGVVTGVGNSGDGNEKMWFTRAQGPGHFLSKVPASARFDGDPTRFSDILSYIANELDGKLPFDVTVEQTTDVGSEPVSTVDESAGPVSGFVIDTLGVEDTLAKSGFYTPKTFTANRHSLADVLKWVRDKVGARIWLSPTEDGVGFVASSSPTKLRRSHRAHYLDGNTAVVNNDALTELRPINTMVVNGAAKDSLGGVGGFQLNTPSDTFVQAKARHVPLYRRAGERELHSGTEEKSDGASKTEVEREAKSKLKEHIDESTGGSMQTLLRSPITPFDTITAKPTCREQPITGTEPITYEVSRVHHEIKSEETSQTTLNVGLHASMGDIEIVGSWEKEA